MKKGLRLRCSTPNSMDWMFKRGPDEEGIETVPPDPADEVLRSNADLMKKGLRPQACT